MRMSCIHCGRTFSITAEQLGGRGRCPHCHGAIRLPNATDQEDEEVAPVHPSHWVQNSLSGLLSLIFHMILILVLALITYDASTGEGLGEDVLIGTLPSEKLGESDERELDAAEVVTTTPDKFDESLDVQPPVDTSESMSAEQLAVAPPSTGGDQTGAFDLGAVTVGGGSMAGGSWDGLLQSLRRYGLDIVITFDSTGSMQGEINQVKQQIQRIGTTLIKLVPKARISICTYRDQGDEYIARGLPLTSDLSRIQSFLAGVRASGGGDEPEAVHEGLAWAIGKNQFRPRARKVILLFGDAPPHDSELALCLRVASDFHGQKQGVVSTVTCRSFRKLPAFVQIAEVGGGESFLTTDERQIMTQLMVLVFGSRHRAKVLEAFKLLDSR